MLEARRWLAHRRSGDDAGHGRRGYFSCGGDGGVAAASWCWRARHGGRGPSWKKESFGPELGGFRPIFLLGFGLGFEVVVPGKATMEHSVIPAIEALNRKDMEGARNLLRIALQVLLVRAVNTVILASDDMRDLLPRDDPLLKKCIDLMDTLARSTRNWVRSVEKDS
ncbi:hypothetical protein PVL29_011590 [Vitis rotundifolia]|uniref:Uncharacterized protein n=1 Tax=Vitis rotundifolia TaxID=103349 RepID=A0AA38ZPH1_VITRO|nr:hypothetical protein PVL29_011590 [Vitis rotundifolia]